MPQQSSLAQPAKMPDALQKLLRAPAPSSSPNQRPPMMGASPLPGYPPRGPLLPYPGYQQSPPPPQIPLGGTCTCTYLWLRDYARFPYDGVHDTVLMYMYVYVCCHFLSYIPSRLQVSVNFLLHFLLVGVPPYMRYPMPYGPLPATK